MRITKFIFLFLVFLSGELACGEFNYDGRVGYRTYPRYNKAYTRYRPLSQTTIKHTPLSQFKVLSSSNCKDETSCVSDPNCLCYCSEVCHYRKKFDSDEPVFLAEDEVRTDEESGEEYTIPKGCYCKQWDLDVYIHNCKKYRGQKSKHYDRNMNIIGKKGHK